MRKRNRNPREVVLRNGTVVPVVRKIVVGFRRTHNGDGVFRRVIAISQDGVAYETYAKGWRPAINQRQTVEQFDRLGKAGAA